MNAEEIVYVVISAKPHGHEPRLPWVVENEYAAFTNRESAEYLAAKHGGHVEEWPADKVLMAVDMWDFRPDIFREAREAEKRESGE